MHGAILKWHSPETGPMQRRTVPGLFVNTFKFQGCLECTLMIHVWGNLVGHENDDYSYVVNHLGKDRNAAKILFSNITLRKLEFFGVAC